MNTTSKTLLLVAILLSTGVVLVGWQSTAFAQANTTVQADFNWDGFEDLAIGVPLEDVGGITDAGAVNVIYGSPGGLSPGLFMSPIPQDQLWHQDSPGIADVAQAGDVFGTASAVGDFNGDGFADLAIGVPGQDIDFGGGRFISDAGAVQVLYGTSAGLSATNNQFWHQNSLDIADVAEAGDKFGFALAVGDFNGDGFADLAVGVLFEDVGSVVDAGAVNVIYGSPTGLAATNNQFWHQDVSTIADVAEQADHFGVALIAGDFNGDSFEDLAVGVPHEETASGFGDTGAVNVIYSTSAGLAAANNQLWDRALGGLAGGLNSSAVFGSALAAGDFDGNGFTDLAVGAPGDTVNGRAGAGSVNAPYGTPGGLAAANSQFLAQGIGAGGAPEAFDRFGHALVADDFTGAGHADLFIGAPGESIGSGSEDFSATFAEVVRAGHAQLIFGGFIGGLSTNFRLGFDQRVIEVVEQNDHFGSALAAGDFDGDGFKELAVGVPFEDVGSTEDAGAVNVFHLTVTPPTLVDPTKSQIWHQNSFSIADVAEERDLFGFALNDNSVSPSGAGLSGEWVELTQDCKKAEEKLKCTLEGTLAVTNPGTATAVRSLLQFFLSADETLDEGDLLLDEVKVGPLEAGETEEVALHVKLPKGQNAAGQFGIAVLDATNVVPEANEENNVVSDPIL